VTLHLLLRKVPTAFSILSGLRRIDKRHTSNTRTINTTFLRYLKNRHFSASGLSKFLVNLLSKPVGAKFQIGKYGANVCMRLHGRRHNITIPIVCGGTNLPCVYNSCVSEKVKREYASKMRSALKASPFFLLH
jgi:hypothetical protein